MSYTAYKCKCCSLVDYSFDNETFRLKKEGCKDQSHSWEPQPHYPGVVHATSVSMLEDAQLDSLKSIYELDRILNIEAASERETKTYNEYLKKI